MPRTVVELGDDLVVGRPRRRAEHHRAVDHLGREVAQRRQLVRRQPGRRAALVRHRRERLGGQRRRDQGAHPPVDGVRRGAGQLLEHDRAHERAEVAVGVTGPVGDRPDEGDETGQDRVASSRLLDRGCQRCSSHPRNPGSGPMRHRAARQDLKPCSSPVRHGGPDRGSGRRASRQLEALHRFRVLLHPQPPERRSHESVRADRRQSAPPIPTRPLPTLCDSL